MNFYFLELVQRSPHFPKYKSLILGKRYQKYKVFSCPQEMELEYLIYNSETKQPNQPNCP